MPPFFQMHLQAVLQTEQAMKKKYVAQINKNIVQGVSPVSYRADGKHREQNGQSGERCLSQGQVGSVSPASQAAAAWFPWSIAMRGTWVQHCSILLIFSRGARNLDSCVKSH